MSIAPQLLAQIHGVPVPQAEFRFHAKRKWRFDYAWRAYMVALEVDGSTWTGGRHTRGAGWAKDTEKLNTAATMGWRMLRCQPRELLRAPMGETFRAAINYVE
jgi:hypothetical protein